MEYGINQLSKLSGVSARTLRYYDEIKLLCPSRTSSSGYRFYSNNEVNLLQQILFYKERGLPLEKIRSILYDESFDMLEALYEHLNELENQERRLSKLINTVKDTIASAKGELVMCDSERFEAFKKDVVNKYENIYGLEAREKYGNDEVDASLNKVLALTREDYKRFQEIGKNVKEVLKEAVLSGEKPESEAGRKAASLHKEWLGYPWKDYTEQKHKGTVDLYIQDARFREYYDREQDGCAEFLIAAVNFWAGKL